MTKSDLMITGYLIDKIIDILTLFFAASKFSSRQSVQKFVRQLLTAANYMILPDSDCTLCCSVVCDTVVNLIAKYLGCLSEFNSLAVAIGAALIALPAA